jgi:hypothetical protein
MKPRNYAALHEAISKWLEDTSDSEERDWMVYDGIVDDMTNAAAAVYRICRKSAEFEQNSGE